MNPSTTPDSATGFTRRSFLGLSAGALALASTPRLFAQTVNPSEKPLRVALVGYGAQGRVLAESLLKIGDIKLVALCDMWDYARTYGERSFKSVGVEVTGYSDLDEMLAKEKGLDAAIIATPDVFHASHTNACLKAGLNVGGINCEVPILPGAAATPAPADPCRPHRPVPRAVEGPA